MKKQCNSIANYTFFLLLFLLFSSCVQELEWDELETISNRLVVEGLLTSEAKQHYVKLSRSRGVIVDGDATGVSGATVSISDGTTTFPLVESSPGLYLTDPTVSGEVGKTYTLRVELDGQVYEAEDRMVESTIPKTVTTRNSERFSGFYFVEYPGNFGAEKPVKLRMHIETPAGWANDFPPMYDIPNFWQERLEGHRSQDTSYYLHPYLETPAVLAYGVLEIGIYPLGTEIHMEHHSLSEPYYEFIRALMAETEWKGLGPFGYNPADVPTNLTNGALGYFGTSHIKKMVQIIRE